MFIPFIPAQPILAAITLVAYHLGIIPPITNIAPTMPTGLGPNTNGSVAALLVALFNPAVATLDLSPLRGGGQQSAERHRAGRKRRRYR